MAPHARVWRYPTLEAARSRAAGEHAHLSSGRKGINARTRSTKTARKHGPSACSSDKAGPLFPSISYRSTLSYLSWNSLDPFDSANAQPSPRISRLTA